MCFEGKYNMIEVLLSETFKSIISTNVLNFIYLHGKYLSRNFVQY